MSLTGDTARLEQLAARLGATTEAVQKAAADIGKVVFDEYQKDFAGQHGPGGESWPESPHSMMLTGALASPEETVSGLSVKIKAEYYGRFHQGGWQVGGERVKMAVSSDIKTRKEKKKTVRIGGRNAGPARPILPKGSDLGNWEPPIEAAARKAVDEHFNV